MPWISEDERLVATYTLKDATKTANGEPLVNAGNLKLIPPAK